MSYSSEVLADSPVIYYDFLSGSTSFPANAGSSAPTLALDAINNTGPTAHNSGGPTGGGWLEWGASQGNIHTTNTITGPNHGTIEFWFRYASAPAANLTLASFSPNSGSSGDAVRVILRTDGKLQADLWVGSVSSITSTSVISTGTWHHVVFNWGSTVTRRIRVDKVDAITSTSVNSSPQANEAFRLHGRWSGAANGEQTGAADIAAAAYYSTALTTTRSDIHYDAAFADATVLAPVATATAAAAVPVVSAGSTVSPPVATASGSAVAPVVTGTGDGTVLAPPATATATALVPVVSAAADVAAPAAAASAAGVVPTVTATASQTVVAPAATAAAGAIAPFVSSDSPDATIEAPVATASAAGRAPLLGVTGTADTSNAFTGRSRDGYATLELTVPVTPSPAVSTTYRVDKAVPLPLPVLVKGRPT